MAFSDHKITTFQKTVSQLPDVPNLTPAALKAQFDAAPEQLRTAVNAVCDDADALDNRVSGIIAQTFDKAVSEPMLDDALRTKLNAKAEQSAVTQLSDAVDTKLTAMQQSISDLIVTGTYEGDGTTARQITLGFSPRAVILGRQNGFGDSGYSYTFSGLFLRDHFLLASGFYTAAEITETGFQVRMQSNSSVATNNSGTTYYYLAIR